MTKEEKVLSAVNEQIQKMLEQKLAELRKSKESDQNK